jgi:hypothetical protein
LVVAREFAPAYTSKHLEPEAGDVVIPLKRHDLDRRKPERVVRGRVVNENGDPVTRAIVEPDGVRRGQGGQFGALDRLGIDVLAVTDSDGEFRLGVGEDGDALYLLIKAPFLAPLRTKPLAAGRTVHQVSLGAGVTVAGRVFKDGRPLAGVGLGMVQVSRSADGFLGHFEYGTDREGRFAFANIPPMESWYIYGLMESLKASGSIPVRNVNTQEHGSRIALGDIEVQPAYRLTGRLVLADGKPVPPETRVIVSRDDAWDSLTSTVGPDGEFSFTGLPAGRISLSTNVREYHASQKNASLDPLNPFRLLGMIKGDVEDLRFLLDPGPRPGYQRPSREEMADYDSRRNGPLRGAPHGKSP